MIMKFGRGIKLDVFYTLVSKKFVTSLLFRVQNSCYRRQILDLAGNFRFHDTVQDQRVISDFFADSVVLTKNKIISLPNGTFFTYVLFIPFCKQDILPGYKNSRQKFWTRQKSLQNKTKFQNVILNPAIT